MITVKIPATSANLGPGFDCLGMALKLYNYFEITKDTNELVFLQKREQSSIPLKDNLIIYSYKKTLEIKNFPIKKIKINLIKCDIPMSRGLGSSATCILAGISAANYVMNNIMTLEEIISIASSIEGHPDNIVPAATGGITVSFIENSDVLYSKIVPPENISFVVMIPDFFVSTKSAREVLPSLYSREDCVYNISRASMLMTSLAQNDISKLRLCISDKIHEPYRKKLIPNLDYIFEKCKELGSLGEFISGSGSTLISIITDDNIDYMDKLNSYLKRLPEKWTIDTIKPDINGMEINYNNYSKEAN